MWLGTVVSVSNNFLLFLVRRRVTRSGRRLEPRMRAKVNPIAQQPSATEDRVGQSGGGGRRGGWETAPQQTRRRHTLMLSFFCIPHWRLRCLPSLLYLATPACVESVAHQCGVACQPAPSGRTSQRAQERTQKKRKSESVNAKNEPEETDSCVRLFPSAHRPAGIRHGGAPCGRCAPRCCFPLRRSAPTDYHCHRSERPRVPASVAPKRLPAVVSNA